MNQIGLSLSGGGIRALVFHIGVLQWLEEEGLWSRISYLSTVSGGSLAIAALFAATKGEWPTRDEFRAHTLPQIRRWLTETSLQGRLATSIKRRPWLLFRVRASLLAHHVANAWGLTLTLQDLPDLPVWRINATCFETGKNWRFSKEKMGDYVFGYSHAPIVPVADAVAASAGYPGLIGPLTLSTVEYEWHNRSFGESEWKTVQPEWPHVTLWDGGVYENSGIEPVYKRRALQHDIDFLVVSDARTPLPKRTRKSFSLSFPFYIPAYRLIEIATDQVRNLRARDIVTYFSETRTGIYVQLGRSASYIQRAAKVALDDSGDWLDEAECRQVQEMETHLKKISGAEFDRLLRHGRETAAVTYGCYIR